MMNLIVTGVISLLLFISSCQLAQHERVQIGSVPQDVEDVFRDNVAEVSVGIWQEGLEVPWSLVFLPDGRALVSERPGRIRMIENGVLREDVYASLDVVHRGEGGLMGLAVHPDFEYEPYIYAMYTGFDGNEVRNKIVRIRHTGDSGEIDRIIIDDIPADRLHNGGRIAFGPDGMLYVTTGEVFNASIAQQLNSPGGKILRITPDGDIPEDNPWPDSPVYSFGHRNPQGIDWHPETGDLFASGHGPSGEFGLRGKDIVNIIKSGRNYGWPLVWGAVNDPDFEDPVIMWKTATPPAGIAFWNGDLLIATLRSQALIRIQMDHDEDEYTITGIERWFASDNFSGVYGRLRDAVVGPDNALYVLTSNRDGRGSPHAGDDRILRIVRNDE